MNDSENCLRQRADCQSEHRRQWRMATQADQTGWYAFSAALAGIIVVLVAAMLCDWTDDRRLAPIVLVLTGCGLFAVPIGVVSSWISRKYFTDTAFPTRIAAVVISSLGVVSIFGWGLVLAGKS